MGLIVDSLQQTAIGGTTGVDDPWSRLILFDDFLSSIPGSDLAWETDVFDGATLFPDASLVTPTHVGIRRLATGPNADGRASLFLSTNQLALGAGQSTVEFLVQFDALSSPADRYAAYIGIGDQPGPLEHNNGVYFEYDDSTSPNWRIVAAAGGVRTKTTTSTPVSSGAWTRLRIDIDSPFTQAEYWVNGVSIGTVSTNIPNSGQVMGPSVRIGKSIGVTSRALYIDLFTLSMRFGTQRT